VRRKLLCGHYAAIRVPDENIIVYAADPNFTDAEKKADELLREVEKKIEYRYYTYIVNEEKREEKDKGFKLGFL